MNKRIYATPEMEFVNFFLDDYKVYTLSGIEEDSGALEESGGDYKGDGNWDF